MSASKRNEWLQSDSDEEDEQSGYDSEAAEERKAIRPAKRRRVSTPDEDEEDLPSGDEDGEDATQEKSVRNSVRKHKQVHKHSNVDEGMEATDKEREASPIAGALAPRRIKTPEVELRQLAKPTTTSASKTGVIYLSRIPPFMKPQTVKHLLEPYGEIGRIFLTPEDPASHTRRVKSGGNKKRSFTDGWVEFQRKKHAKIAAESLNAQIIGGKKGGWYHDDIWNIKYLKGFKWHHLTEQIANENAERAARLRTEISQTSKENKRFVANVERAKMLEGMAAKKKQRAAAQVSSEASSEAPSEAAAVPMARERNIKQIKSSFRQNEVRSKSDSSRGAEPTVQRVLSKIF